MIVIVRRRKLEGVWSWQISGPADLTTTDQRVRRAATWVWSSRFEIARRALLLLQLPLTLSALLRTNRFWPLVESERRGSTHGALIPCTDRRPACPLASSCERAWRTGISEFKSVCSIRSDTLAAFLRLLHDGFFFGLAAHLRTPLPKVAQEASAAAARRKKGFRTTFSSSSSGPNDTRTTRLWLPISLAAPPARNDTGSSYRSTNPTLARACAHLGTAANPLHNAAQGLQALVQGGRSSGSISTRKRHGH